jgi:hypothetical protein
MNLLDGWRERAGQVTFGWQDATRRASERVTSSVASGFNATASVAGEAYTAALNWKNNSEFSNWLADHLSSQRATLAVAEPGVDEPDISGVMEEKKPTRH